MFEKLLVCNLFNFSCNLFATCFICIEAYPAILLSEILNVKKTNDHIVQNDKIRETDFIAFCSSGSLYFTSSNIIKDGSLIITTENKGTIKKVKLSNTNMATIKIPGNHKEIILTIDIDGHKTIKTIPINN